jgi:hypothetical protein
MLLDPRRCFVRKRFALIVAAITLVAMPGKIVVG